MSYNGQSLSWTRFPTTTLSHFCLHFGWSHTSWLAGHVTTTKFWEVRGRKNLPCDRGHILLTDQLDPISLNPASITCTLFAFWSLGCSTCPTRVLKINSNLLCFTPLTMIYHYGRGCGWSTPTKIDLQGIETKGDRCKQRERETKGGWWWGSDGDR